MVSLQFPGEELKAEKRQQQLLENARRQEQQQRQQEMPVTPTPEPTGKLATTEAQVESTREDTKNTAAISTTVQEDNETGKPAARTLRSVPAHQTAGDAIPGK